MLLQCFWEYFRYKYFICIQKRLYWLASTGNTLNTVQSKKYGLWGQYRATQCRVKVWSETQCLIKVWSEGAILWKTLQSKSMVCGGGPCEWDKWSCPRKAWMRPWKPYLNLVSTKFSLQKWSSEPAVYVSTMRQCLASEYFFEASKKHTCVICEHGQTPFEERDNLNISLPGVEAKIYHHLLETFFCKASSLHLQVQNLKLDKS